MSCALNRIPVLNKKASKTQIENALETYIYIYRETVDATWKRRRYMLKLYAPVPQNVTLFAARAFTVVIKLK